MQHGTGEPGNQVTSAQHKVPQNGGGFPKAPMLAMIEERSFESQASVDSPIMAPSLKSSNALDILNSKSSGVSNTSNAIGAPKPQRTPHLSAAFHYEEKRPLVRLNSIDTETPESSSDAESGDLRSLRNSNSSNNVALTAARCCNNTKQNCSDNQISNVSQALTKHHNNQHENSAESEWLLPPSDSTSDALFDSTLATDGARSDAATLIDTSCSATKTVVEDLLKA